MRAWCVVVVLAACSKDKPDCEKYVARMMALSAEGLGDSRKKSLESVNREDCEHGKVSASVASCVIAASTMDDVRKCNGIAPIERPGSVASSNAGSAAVPAKPRVKRKGFSVALPAGWISKDEKVADDELLMRGSNNTAGAFLSRVAEPPKATQDAGACRTAAQLMAKNTGATFKSSQIVQTKLGPACHTIHTDPNMVIQSDSVAAGGGTMIVTCFYELTRSDPAPYCAEILDSLTFE